MKHLGNTLTTAQWPRSVRGLSLVELMVSVVIGLFLVLGATTLYVNSRKTADVDDSIARLQENARYAMSILETDVRMANYWGLMNDANMASNKIAAAVNQGGVSDASKADALISSITGMDSCGTNYPVDIVKYVEATSNSFPTTFTGNCAAHSAAVGSADTLTIRRANTPVATLDSTKLQLCTDRNSLEVILGGACANEIHDLSTNIYYVDKSSDQSANYPSLRRISLVKGPAFTQDEIIPGVEDMQVEFGWGPGTETAVSGNPAANAQAVSYLQPNNAAITGHTGQIVAVRIWLLMRAEAQDKSYLDTNIYEYGDRSKGSGTNTTNDLSATGAAGKAYKPNNNYRRMLVSKTFFIRNAIGT